MIAHTPISVWEFVLVAVVVRALIAVVAEVKFSATLRNDRV
jgi:hypothetical protein